MGGESKGFLAIADEPGPETVGPIRQAEVRSRRDLSEGHDGPRGARRSVERSLAAKAEGFRVDLDPSGRQIG